MEHLGSGHSPTKWANLRSVPSDLWYGSPFGQPKAQQTSRTTWEEILQKREVWKPVRCRIYEECCADQRLWAGWIYHIHQSADCRFLQEVQRIGGFNTPGKDWSSKEVSMPLSIMFQIPSERYGESKALWSHRPQISHRSCSCFLKQP